MEKEKDLNFFQKLKISIFNLEKYGTLIVEKPSKSIKYILTLVFIFTLCYCILFTTDAVKMLNTGMSYIKNEMPDFTLEDGIINFEKPVDGYDEKYDFKILSLDKPTLEDAETKEYNKYSNYLIFLQDKLILKVNESYREYTYSYLRHSLGIEKYNKQGIIDAYDGLGGQAAITVIIGVTLLVAFFLANTIEVAGTCLCVALFGYAFARICKIKIRFETAITLSIYSLSLSLVLNLIYMIQFFFTKFEIQYFDVVYMAIAYIYIIAAILIIKTDLMKQIMELRRIQEIQENIIKKEIEEKEQEEKDKQEEKKNKEKDKDKKEGEDDKAPEINDQPDGSEI